MRRNGLPNHAECLNDDSLCLNDTCGLRDEPLSVANVHGLVASELRVFIDRPVVRRSRQSHRLARAPHRDSMLVVQDRDRLPFRECRHNFGPKTSLIPHSRAPARRTSA